MVTDVWTKIAINTYKYISTRDSENAIAYNGGGVSWSTNTENTSLIARV